MVMKTLQSASRLRTTKFVLYNLANRPIAYYQVDRKMLSDRIDDSSLVDPDAIAHSILAIDPFDNATTYSIPLFKEYDCQVFVSHTAKQIHGSYGWLKIEGLKPTDDGVVYQYKTLTESEFDRLTDIPIVQQDESVFALAQFQLISGDLNRAKYALNSTLNVTLNRRHAKALSNRQLVNFSDDLNRAIYHGEEWDDRTAMGARSDGVNPQQNISFLEAIALLKTHRDRILLNLERLQEDYTYRGIKRVAGYRDEQGNLVPPLLETKYIDGGVYIPMGTFEINRKTATINLRVTRRVKLIQAKNQAAIDEVGGVLLNDLKAYNTYTLVSDGKRNINSLKVKFSRAKTFNLFREKHLLLDATEFDPNAEYEIPLDSLPLVPQKQNYSHLQGLFQELAVLRILSSLFNAYLKEVSEDYTQEQLQDLNACYISKNLYVNFPTTNAYRDLKEALDTGEVEARIRYQIDVGNGEILNLGQLRSANQFLQKFYEVCDRKTGQKIDKPTFAQTLSQPVLFTSKTSNSRNKTSQVDNLMKSIFDDFFGLESTGKATDMLSQVGASELVKDLQQRGIGSPETTETFIAALTDARGKVNRQIEHIYRESISPLVFYIGTLGLIPDELDAVVYTAEALSAKYPDLTFSRSEKEGLFFEVDDAIISVYPKTEYFTVN